MKIFFLKIRRPAFSVAAALSLWFIFPFTVLNLIPLLLGGLYFIAFPRIDSIVNRRIRLVSASIAAVFSLFTLLANLSNILIGDSALFSLFRLAVGFFGLLLLYDALLRFFYSKSIRLDIVKDKKSERTGLRRPIFVFLFCFAAILLIWGVFFLRFYPGILTVDSIDQLRQATGLSPYSNHHPVLHTLFIELFYSLGFRLLGNANAAVATVSVAQMLLLALLYAYFLYRLYKQSVNRILIALFLCYFSIVPYNIMLSFSIWKDVLFGAVVLLFCLLLWELLALKLSKAGYILHLVGIFFSGVGFCLLRSNGFYAFLIALPFLAVALFKKKRLAILPLLLSIIVSFVIRGPVYRSLGIPQPDAAEHLSIPLQQIARVVADGKPLTDEQQKALEKFLPTARIAEVYDPHVSDNMKMLARNEGDLQYLADHGSEFIKLWLGIGARNPYQYLTAFVDGTMGYWYPDVRYWVYETSVVENDLGVYSDPKIKGFAASVIDAYVQDPSSVPFYTQTTSRGYAAWAMFILAGLAVVRKNKRALLVFLPVFFIWLSLLISTPVYAEFRYIYSLFTTLPLLLVASFYKPESTAMPADPAIDKITSTETQGTSNS